MTSPKTKKIDPEELYAKLEKLAIAQAVKEAGLAQVRASAAPARAKGPSVKASDKKTYEWTIASFDVMKTLKPAFENTSALQLEGAEMPWEVTVQLSHGMLDKVKASPRLNQFQMSAKQLYDNAIKSMEDKIIVADSKIDGLANTPLSLADKEKEAQQIARKLFEDIAADAKVASEKAKKTCTALLAEWKKEDKDLAKWYVNAGVKIGGAVGTIIGSASVIAGSFGTATPAAAFGLTRGILTLGQEITRLSLSANQRYDACKAELAILKKAMDGIDEGQKKNINSFKELTANILAKGTGLELPSVKNFNTHVKDYAQDVTKLKHKLDETGKKYNKYLDVQSKFTARLAELDLPAAKRQKIEKAYNEVITSTAFMPAKVEKALADCRVAVKQYAELKKIGDAMQKGAAGWVKYVDPIVGAVMDVGLVFVSEGPDLPQIIETTAKVVSISQSAAQLIVDELDAAGIMD